MAHYAFLDRNNKVVEVIVGKDENQGIHDWEIYYGSKRGMKCVRTSFNTVGGVHTQDGTPFRKNYAGIGYTYDAERDAFIPPQPYSSWTLNEETCLWDPPVPYPSDEQAYTWDEETLKWIVVE